VSKQANIEEIYPLSPLQAGMLFHTQMDASSGVYFEQLTCALHGELDSDAFGRSWQLLAERHSILRTAFVWQGQREPLQVVHKTLQIPWTQEDWRHLDPDEQTAKLEQWLRDDRRAGFALNRAPLLRIATLRMADDFWQLVSSHHHIILDGWSFPLLLQEFGESYRAFCAGSVPRFAPPIPFSRYIAWLKGRSAIEAEQFWRQELAGFTSPPPIGMARGRAENGEYGNASHLLSGAQTEQLQTAARAAGVTLNTLVQGAYATVLSRYSGSPEVVFGVTVAGRPAELKGVESIVGLFINSLPMRVRVAGDAHIAPWLAGLQERQLSLNEFSYAGLTDIQKWSEVPRGQPLFETLLVFENYPVDESLPDQLGGLAPRNISFVERSNYPLTIIAIPGARLTLRASFDSQRLEGAAVQQMLEHIGVALMGLTALDSTIREVEIIEDDERSEILRHGGRSTPSADSVAALHVVFSTQARATPDAIAITSGEEEVSYRALDAASDAVARELAGMGIQPADRVGLLLDRSANLVAGILGILKCGAAYVPMDPVYPDERIAWMVADSGIRVVLTQRSLSARVPCSETICLDEPRKTDPASFTATVPIDPSSPAYVIYTSGSTGRPKGCVITHANVSRLFQASQHWFSFGPSDVWTLFHSAAFDFSVWEIWGALLYGGRLAVVPYYQSREPEAFLELVIREQVTVLNQTPSAFRQFMLAEEAKNIAAGLALRYVIFGGEALNLGSLRSWFARHGESRPQLVNMYGITETTVHVTYRPLTAADAAENQGSLIGEPIPDLGMVVLDHQGHLAPIGITGELFVAGAGLSPGYLGRPALTAERFIPDSFGLDQEGGRLYRTGDLARLLPGGSFEYLGRCDHQVKIRGFRIELGEIESELSVHPEVLDVAVEVRDERLVAYLVTEAGQPAVDELRTRLLQRLPAYMVPAAFVFLERLPLTQNGKLDRRALPPPGTDGQGPSSAPVEPRNEREAKLAAIWRDVLGLAQVGIRDNYFALGGDSIRSLAIRSRARQNGIEFSLQELFEKQTIEALLSNAGTEAPPTLEPCTAKPFFLAPGLDPSTIPGDVEDAYPLTSLQLGMLFHSHEHVGSSSYLDTFSFHLRGVLHEGALQEALDSIVARNAVLRTSFDLTAQPEPLQQVHRAVSVPIGWTDLSALLPSTQDHAVDAFVREEATKPLDWTLAPLFRVHVHKRTGSFQFTLSVHHAILDGWSVASLLTELFHIYLHRIGRGPKPVQRRTHSSFADFVKLERNAIASQASRTFWLAKLQGASFLSLPKPSEHAPLAIGSRYGTLPLLIPQRVADGLTQVSERLGIPLKSILLTAHVRVLSLIGGQRDVVTGLVSNGRPEETDGEHLAGLFLNVLPFRFFLADGNWEAMAKAVFAEETAAMPHRRVPLVELQRRVGTGPLFDTDFNFVNFHVFDSLRGVDALHLLDSRTREETNFTLATNFSRDNASGSINGSLSVDYARFAPHVAAVLPALYLAALRAMAETPNWDWRQTQITAPTFLSGDSMPVPGPFLLHQLVEAQVDQTPHAIAVIDEAASITYAELEARANRLAHWLRGHLAGPEERVGIVISRSTELVVALLAVLKAGGAWVPLDPAHPDGRIALLNRDIRAVITLSDETLAANASAIRSQPSTRPNAAVWPECAAYVLYTSGSTGRPKGVVITHEAIVNHMLWMQHDFPLQPDDVVLQKTPLTFDASVWEFWAPLISGATLAMARPGGHQDPEYLAEAVQTWGVTTIQLVPSMLDFFLESMAAKPCRSLRRLFSGGEQLRPETRDRVFQLLDVQLINLYGPTEATIDALVHVCGRAGEVPIGRPVANMQGWILDTQFSPVPAGVAGELFLGGAGLGRGYFGAPALSAERFVPNPFSAVPGQRMYRTGDVVRLREDGLLVFVGRADFQLKIRGHRVEPGEVESALESLPGIERALVVGRQNEGVQSLVAYIVSRPGDSLSTEEISGLLRLQLPRHMVPAFFVMLNELPLGPNGKVDRGGLPAPQAVCPAAREAVALPKTAIEERLSEIWKRVLGISAVSIHDNFFELGGDSIQSLRLVSLAAQAGWRIRPKQVFDHPTIASLSQIVDRTTARAASTEVGVDAENIPLLPVQAGFFALRGPNPHHWNQSVLLQTRVGLSRQTAESAWRHVVERHDAFRLRFRQESGGWRQWLTEAAACPFVVAPIAEMGRRMEEAQKSLNLEQGPLAASTFFEDADGGPGRWMIVAHHLVTDGVSWRVLLEELALSCHSSDLKAIEETTFAAWAVRLRGEASKPETLAEAPYWVAVAEGSGNRLPLVPTGHRELNVENTVQSVQTLCDETLTTRLLRELPRLYRCSVEEMLLTALSAAMQEWAGGGVLVDLESHGREESVGGGELSQTVGWFTTVYPVRLPEAGEDCWSRLRAVKETLRHVPRNGVGYGILRNYAPDPSLRARLAASPRADISFNYLGQLDQVLSADGPFQPAPEESGAARDGASPRSNLIDVVAKVSGGRLQVEWLYSKALHTTGQVEAAAAIFQRELSRLLTDPQPAMAIVGSDFPFVGLDQAALRKVVESCGEVVDIWPVTALQEGMLLHSVHGDDPGNYVQQISIELHGTIDLAALRTAWNELARRHEVLRSEFRWEDLTAPCRIVRGEVPIEVSVFDWSAQPDAAIETPFGEWLLADRSAGFDLTQAPLWCVTLFRFGNMRSRLVWSHHHLLLDGWSLPLIFEQLTQEYAAAAGASISRQQEARFNYSDYLGWLSKRDSRAEADFWRDWLNGYRPPSQLELGATPSGELIAPAARASSEWSLSAHASRNLRVMAERLQVTLGTCLQAVWGLLLARWTKQQETVFGVVVAGRPVEVFGIESAVGMFINTVAMRVRLDPAERVDEWIRRLHNNFASLRQFEHSRLVDVLSWSDVPRGEQLFETLLIIENYPMDQTAGHSAAGVSFGKVEAYEQTSLPLNLYVVPGEQLTLRLEYSRSRFTAASINALAESITWLISDLPSRTGEPLGRVGVLPSEQFPAVAAYSLNKREIWDRTPVHDRIARQAVRNASSIAIEWENETLSYSQLEYRSNQLAHHLRAAGATANSVVGVYLDRSPTLVLALLGILKAGAAYVPMDPAFPLERLGMMVADSELSMVVTDTALGGNGGFLPSSIVQIRIDADATAIAAQPVHALGHSVSGDELAYLIFTSGSSGRPKGVQVTHRGLANFLSHFADKPGLDARAVLLAVTTLSFDIAGLELFLPLSCGAKIVIVPRESVSDAEALARLLSSTKASVMQATPATWRLLLESDWSPAAGFQAWCGGESLPSDLAQSLLERGVLLWNLYGPTETTIWSTAHQVTDPAESACIGRPITNTHAWVMDEHMNPVPPGMVGQLYLGGEGVARGYVGRPGLTAERFVPDPFSAGNRLYATGDSVRWDGGGTLRFLGRSDQQVKIRGFRIELEEIETALRSVPGIQDAAVTARRDSSGSFQLVAFAQGLADAGGASEVRAQLRLRLPEYMLPSTFQEIISLPRTPNGKIDRLALPKEVRSSATEAASFAPRNPLEQVLLDLWKDVLGNADLGVNSNFFEHGGHSLLAAQVLSRIQKYFQVQVALRTFFQTATPEAVSAMLLADEPVSARILKTAAALVRLRAMSPEELEQLKTRAAANDLVRQR
jgi:amino acid adenylation domain-containing protein/non-ribosomal peptide synthase protein (TIGR01720 family)